MKSEQEIRKQLTELETQRLTTLAAIDNAIQALRWALGELPDAAPEAPPAASENTDDEAQLEGATHGSNGNGTL